MVYTSERPDSEIAAEVAESLQRDVWVDSLLIHSDVRDGKVTLTGTVGSVAEKARAISDTWTSGVKIVDDNGLVVDPMAEVGSMKRQQQVKIKSDDEIVKAVEEAFLHDPRVRSSKPNTAADNAYQVGARRVINNLQVK